MAIDFKKTKTFSNLQTAFAGESQASMKYRFYSSKAKKDGYVHLSKVFDETSQNEKEHAEIWFKIMKNNGEIFGQTPTTLANLNDAINGEKYEWSDMYLKFAKEAKSEGYAKIAYLFEAVGNIEKFHEERYKNFVNEIKNKSVFVAKKEVYWFCLNCGALIKSKKAPLKCPVCNHDQAYFVQRDVKIA